ncbi:MAG: hypothetical protein AAF570_05275 [Bacteroidota bacterium]
MLETRNYRFVRNILWPFKSSVEISDAGINNKGKMTRWEDISEFNHHIQVINGSPSYQINYRNAEGKNTMINFVVPITAKKAKKQLCKELYAHLAQGFHEKVTEPQSDQVLADIDAGKEITIAKCKMTKDGIEIRKGKIKKTSVYVAWNDLQIDNKVDRGLGIGCLSASNPSNKMIYHYHEVKNGRILARVIEKRVGVFMK